MLDTAECHKFCAHSVTIPIQTSSNSIIDFNIKKKRKIKLFQKFRQSPASNAYLVAVFCWNQHKGQHWRRWWCSLPQNKLKINYPFFLCYDKHTLIALIVFFSTFTVCLHNTFVSFHIVVRPSKWLNKFMPCLNGWYIHLITLWTVTSKDFFLAVDLYQLSRNPSSGERHEQLRSFRLSQVSS